MSFFNVPITGGEQLLARSEEAINQFFSEHGFGGNLQNGWGMCELGATAAASSSFLLSQQYKYGSVGVPMPLVTIAVFDPETNEELRCGERGELRVMSPCSMLGYYKNPQATEEFFHTDEQGRRWACTGDMGYIDENGFVYVLGRESAFFTAPDDTRHYLFDTENAILQDCAVDLCAVVDMGKEKQPFLTAHIVLSEDCSETPKDIVERVDALCREKLDDFAVPKAYKIRTEFAIKPSGKRDTAALLCERDGYLDANVKEIVI